MSQSPLDAVTGATGYSGKYIALNLLERGRRVMTLTNRPDRPTSFGERVRAAPLNFADPGALGASLTGVDTLYNTYWVRYSHGGMTHERAVENTLVLFDAARRAGVRRVVHISITNPDVDSPLSYFRGKARIEAALAGSGLSYAILRPAVLFGGESGEDILLNNIAWLLRHFPVFAVIGRGDCRLQPIHVRDLAELAVGLGQGDKNTTIDAVGPETYAFIDLVRLIRGAVGSRALLLKTPPGLAWALSRLVGLALGDVILTRDEVRGLMANLLISEGPPGGRTRLSTWLEANADRIGVRYASELGRRRP